MVATTSHNSTYTFLLVYLKLITVLLMTLKVGWRSLVLHHCFRSAWKSWMSRWCSSYYASRCLIIIDIRDIPWNSRCLLITWIFQYTVSSFWWTSWIISDIRASSCGYFIWFTRLLLSLKTLFLFSFYPCNVILSRSYSCSSLSLGLIVFSCWRHVAIRVLSLLLLFRLKHTLCQFIVCLICIY